MESETDSISSGEETPTIYREAMDVAALSAWLRNSGIPERFCRVFEENYIDGKEFMALTEDEVKKMVPAIGIAKKICRLLPQSSWIDKLSTRVSNLKKRAARKLANRDEPGTPGKRGKKLGRKSVTQQLSQRYPIHIGSQDDTEEDEESCERHFKAISKELEKAKPRDTVLLPLMKLTYFSRRAFVENEAKSVRDIFLKFPALKRPANIEQEMGLVMKKADVRQLFVRKWMNNYVPAILEYGEKSRKKEASQALENLDATDEASRQAAALRILCSSISSMKHLDYVYKEYEMTETPDEACKDPPGHNAPRIAVFKSAESSQYFLVTEQQIVCEVPSLQLAVFLCFSAYYVYNLAYPKEVKGVFLFFQDYVLEYPDSHKRPGTYLAVAADIKRCVPSKDT